MAGKNDKLIVGWADGTRRNFAKSTNRQGSWAALKAKLSRPRVTGEKRAAFDKMSKDEQDDLKSIAGWISGAQIRGQHRSLKNVLPRDLLTIDIDYGTGEIGTPVDTAIHLFDINGILVNVDQSNPTDGGSGSVSANDAFLQHTFTTTGTFVIQIGRSVGGSLGSFQGGEEFLVYLLDATAEHAAAVAQRLCRAVQNIRLT